MMMSSCGFGFAHDVDTQQVQVACARVSVATNSISTVCLGGGQSSTHSCSTYAEFIKVLGIWKLRLDTSIKLGEY